MEDMIAFAPYMEEKLRLWDKYVDFDGKTTLNIAEYMLYRAQLSDLAKEKKKQKAAKKGKKGKL